MPKMRQGRVDRDELPATIRRSDEHAQRIFAESHDSAMQQYRDEARAHQVAYAALKHSYERVGDRWEQKAHPGPSDSRAEHDGGSHDAPTAGGVDARASKSHLMEVARRLNVRGRSRMNKADLVTAIQRANDRASRRSDSSGG